MEKRRALRIALMVALCAATAVPCSWDSTPTYAFRVRPDDPIDRYVDGRIGILGREYARSHLVIAYRYLSGNPPGDEERAGFLELLQHRLKETVPERPAQEWEALRAEIRGVQPGREPYTERDGGGYSWFTNCTNDAFLKAMDVLRDRAARFGAKSPAVASWLDAQEIVFANCSEGEAIPKPADASLPPLIRADRAYQIAAAHFYAMKYDDARARFLEVASDAGSPWRQTARFVAARALIRKATIEKGESEPESYAFVKEPMEAAERDLRVILADPAMAPFHEQARRLLHFVVFRLRPPERFAEVAAALARGSSPADEARGNLGDYTFLLDVDVNGDDDLTNWIRTFQSGADATATWRATKKLHWLVAALAAAKADGAADLLEASAKIGADSVAYPMIAYHRARLLVAANKPDDARAELDRVLALDEDKLPPSSRNLLLEQRRTLARSLAEYLRDAQVTAVGLESDQVPETFTSPLLPPDVADVLSGSTPLDVLAEAAMTKELPKEIRNPILVAAWTRAILLDREKVASRLAPGVFEIDPSLETRFATWLKASGSARRFAAADLIVHYGGLQPNVQWFGGRLADSNDVESVDHSSGNWWCGREFETRTTPVFLADRAGDAATEHLALLELNSGTSWMLQTFIDWADAQPKDPRVPEGLSLAVKGTRWSCGDGGTDALAEAAFTLLHKRYASTQWAKETPYWYRSGF